MQRLVVVLTLAIALVFSGASATLALRLSDGGGGAAGSEAPCAIESNVPSTQAKSILACLSPSIAFVETALGTGSGILVADNYLVTNAHVVDPFGAVDLVFEGGERHEAVPVKGVDLVADIALVGPVPTKRPALAMGGSPPLEKGDDVYLVGYPGEVDDQPDATISRGILSRTRRASEHGLTFLQTDAAIGGGQSGGALVDGAGNVVGVSGLSFAEEFALALSSANVRRSIARILDGDTPDYRSFPADGATAGTFSLPDDVSIQVLTVAASEQARTVRLSLPAPAQPALTVVDIFGEMLFVNQAALDAAAAFFGPLEDPGAAGAPVAPGVFEFEIPEDTYALVLVGTRRPAGAEIPFTSTVPLGRYDDVDQNRPIQPGDMVRGEIDHLEIQGDSFLIELTEGQTIEVHASSAVGDLGFIIQGPGQPAAEATFVDDSGIGLFDADAEDTYTAKVAGTHRIIVVSSDGLATGYRLSVAAG